MFTMLNVRHCMCVFFNCVCVLLYDIHFNNNNNNNNNNNCRNFPQQGLEYQMSGSPESCISFWPFETVVVVVVAAICLEKWGGVSLPLHAVHSLHFPSLSSLPRYAAPTKSIVFIPIHIAARLSGVCAANASTAGKWMGDRWLLQQQQQLQHH